MDKWDGVVAQSGTSHASGGTSPPPTAAAPTTKGEDQGQKAEKQPGIAVGFERQMQQQQQYDNSVSFTANSCGCRASRTSATPAASELILAGNNSNSNSDNNHNHKSNKNKDEKEARAGWIMLLPLNLIIECILPFLSRHSWNRFVASYKDLYVELLTKQRSHSARGFLPPWPERIFQSNLYSNNNIHFSTNDHSTIAEVQSVAFSHEGELLACELTFPSSRSCPKLIRVYHQKTGLYRTIENGEQPCFSPTETTLAFRGFRKASDMTARIVLWNYHYLDKTEQHPASIDSWPSLVHKNNNRHNHDNNTQKIMENGGIQVRILARTHGKLILGFHKEGTILFLCDNHMAEINMIRIQDGARIHSICIEDKRSTNYRIRMRTTIAALSTSSPTRKAATITSSSTSAAAEDTCTLALALTCHGHGLFVTDFCLRTTTTNQDSYHNNETKTESHHANDKNTMTSTIELPKDFDALCANSGSNLSSGLEAGKRFTAMEFSPCGNYLACGKANGTIELWDVPNRSLERILPASPQSSPEPVCSLCFSSTAGPRSLILAASARVTASDHCENDKNNIRLWNIGEDEKEKEPRIQNSEKPAPSSLNATAMPCPQTSQLLRCKGGQEEEIQNPISKTVFLKFSPCEGRFLASASITRLCDRNHLLTEASEVLLLDTGPS